MTDNPSSQKSFPASPETSQPSVPLQYPQILLDSSFDSLLTHSFPSTAQSSTSTMRGPSPQQDAGSLSESWASMSELDFSHDEDLQSEHTDVGSLVGSHSVDDVLSVADEDEHSGDGEHVEETQSVAAADEDQVPELKESMTTNAEVKSLSEAGGSASQILLAEGEHSAEDQIIVSHAIRIFSDEETQQLSAAQRVNSDSCVGVISMGMSDLSLKDKGYSSLRVLLFGPEYTSTLRNDIVGKLADALIASGPSNADSDPPTMASRYHVIPDSFGPGSHPTAAEVIPIDCQLEVDQYHHSTWNSAEGIKLHNQYTQKTISSKWNDTNQEYCIFPSATRQHDLAIIVISKDDSKDTQKSARQMLTFAQRHQVPVMVVSVDEAWDTESCRHILYQPAPIQLRNLNQAKLRIDFKVNNAIALTRGLPLDLDTFLSLNSAQLSRHLTQIILISSTQKEKREVRNRLDLVGEQQKAGHGDGEGFIALLLGHFTVNQICSAIIVLLISIYVPIFMAFWKAVPVSSETPHSLLRTAEHSTSTTPIIAPSTTSMATVSTPPSIASLIAMPTEFPLMIDGSKSSTDTFEVEVVGSSHLVVRTPRKPKGKKGLQVEVTRDDKVINATVKQLFPCVYSVRLPTEDAHGELNVSLRVPQPLLVKNVTVDLGKIPLELWIKNLLDESDEQFHKMVATSQQSLEDFRNSEVVQVVRDKVDRLFTDASQQLENVKNRFQSSKAKIDIRRKSAQFLALRQKRKQQLRKFAQRTSDISQNVITKVFAEFQKLKELEIKKKVNEVAQRLHDNTQSETLSTAQDRAQHIVKGFVENMKAARDERRAKRKNGKGKNCKKHARR